MANAILNNNSICELVRKTESDYVSGQTTISEYVSISVKDTLNRIDAYLNSKHISGEVDDLGREKPFFNIVKAAVNIWFRATDIDRKNVSIKPSSYTEDLYALLATIHLQNYMNKDAFGKFLNTWGLTLARYGSAITKFVEQNGKLHALVVPWQRVIVDAIDFDNNPKIEILEYTPAQLRKNKAYDKEMVDALIKAQSARTTISGITKDQKDNYIKLYEIHGELPLSWLTGKEKDDDIYTQQMQVISFVAGKQKGKFDDYVLVSGKEKEDPYMITHLIEEEGQTLSMGAVQNIFDSQWMVNYTAKSIKDQLDLASKLVFQTADPNFVGMSVLSSIETGNILIYDAQKDPNGLRQVQNNSHDITSLQSYGQQWQALGKEIDNASDLMMGKPMPSSTTLGETKIAQYESHSLFEIMTENKGLALEEMMRRYIIPYLKKQMNTSKEVVATLDMYGIDRIEEKYISTEAIKRSNKKAVQSVLNRETPQINLQAEQEQIRSELKLQGNNRFIRVSEVETKTWKEFFKDMKEWYPKVEIVPENTDKKTTLTALSSVLSTVAGLQGQPMSPEMQLVFNSILREIGHISPVELSSVSGNQSAQQVPIAPIGVGQNVRQNVGIGNNNQPIEVK